ncbi:hypothetical protein TorRG33x02_126810 [Trema orientale]|uniref:Uncharacterized protein n=1 Tax=Trema orientale TaxID=63057 RepID=A0A2P5F0U0_TREOI|nr:hypothetical protein TorRG33x02_126810 [Trema orientale]
MDLQLRSFKGSKRNDHGHEGSFKKPENEEEEQQKDGDGDGDDNEETVRFGSKFKLGDRESSVLDPTGLRMYLPNQDSNKYQQKVIGQ